MRNFLILILSALSMTIAAQTTISIIGTATQHNDWTTDIVMTETSASSGIWTATIPLYAGTTFGSPNAVKFRETGNWGVNWGDNDNAFPMGNGVQNEANIDIPVSGYYDISFNTATGEYSFAPHNAIIYVNDDANAALGYRHGQDWAHAYTSLQDALALAHWFTSVDEVWVAEGTYKPSAYPHGCTGCATSRDYTFHLRDGLKIYGGFAGTETSIGARNIAAHPTILSGDFNDDDVVTGSGATLTITGNGENAHHVVLAVAPSSGGIGVTVDGFRVTGGNADGISTIQINGSNPNRHSGGGLYTRFGTNTMTNNTIYGNNSVNDGGGIKTYYGINTLTNNMIYKNIAESGAGIIFILGENHLYNNTISENNATYYAAILTYQGQNIFTNNTIINNNGQFGGGIFTFSGTTTLKNNLFWNNQTAGNPNLSFSDLANDCCYIGVKYFTNNMLQLPNNTTNYPTTGGTTYTNNIYAQDPLFVNPTDPDGPDNIHRTADDGLSIQPCSPAINAGTPTGAPVEDITGYTRTGNPDIGAYENNPATVSRIFVNDNATGLNDGTSWANAFTSLQSALQAAHTCPGIDEVWVAEGTYKPSAYPQACTGCVTARDYTFHLRDGLKIYGGFAGTEITIGARNIAAHPTILSGDFNGDDVVTGSGATLTITGNGENAHHVVLAVAPSSGGIGVTVDGFNITGGNADGSSNIQVNVIYVNRYSGGGINTSDGTNTLTNNTIYGNYSVSKGGGIYTSFGTNTLTNNTIYGNHADDGGGINAVMTNCIINNNSLIGNYAQNNGGGININEYNCTITNNFISENSALKGGGVAVRCTTFIANNNTLVNNYAINGGGIYSMNGSAHILKDYLNNIFWANQKGGSTTVAGADYENNPTSPASNTFTNNMLQLPNNTTNYPTTGGTTYSNNIYATDPLFVDPADPDGIDNIHRTADDGLSIQSCSPAINAGTLTGAPTQDITGYTRTGNPDIGAYENNPSVVSIVYVKHNATGLNDGTSWANAFTSLQSALQAAHTCPGIDEVWVAEGTYKPSAYPHGCSGCATARDYTFHLRDGLKIYGGFAGTETSIGARNIAAHPTILSGDFNGDDVVTGSGATLSITGNGENAHHVVLAVAPYSGGIGVTIDGFNITGGNADGSGTHPTINTQNVKRNSGAALYTFNGDNIVNNCIIKNNKTGQGGDTDGGAIYCENGTNQILNNTIENNLAYGGLSGFKTGCAITIIYGNSNSIFNNKIYQNNGSYGTVTVNLIGGASEFNSNEIYENNLGAIEAKNSNCTISNNTIFGNTNNNTIGIINTFFGNNIIINNVIYSNNTTYGGGISTFYGTTTLRNNIFWANQKGGSTTAAGADYGGGPSDILENNMLQLTNNTTNYPTSGGTTYSNNIYATDPLFVDPSDPDGPDNLHRTADDGLSIQPCSPAINAGTPTGAPVEDITGYTRTGNPDIGAYENNPATVSRIFVNDNATGLNDGTSWANAFTSLQSALQKAHLCADIDEVWVAEGTYKPSAYPHGCSGCATAGDYTFHLRDGLKIYGGFAGTETSIGARNIAAHPTILSGDFNDDDVVTGSGATLSITGNGENAHHVVLAVAPSSGGIGVTVDGFRVTGGNADVNNEFFLNSTIVGRYGGGGILIYFGTNTLSNNSIYGNYSYSSGGGINSVYGINTLTNNSIYSNYSNDGGGFSSSYGTNTLTNNTIYYNNAGDLGGGIFYGWCTNTIINNTIFENSAGSGGGIAIWFGNSTISNNAIYQNYTIGSGGGIGATDGNITLTNNTIYKNSSNFGGGLGTQYSTINLVNNIFWANQKSGSATAAGSDYENSIYNPSTNILENNMLQLTNNTTNYPTSGGTTYSNNIYATDPLFVDPSDPDGPDNLHRTADDGLSIQPCSPAINAGTPTGAPVEDITRYTRTGNPDIGAYENNPATVSRIFVNDNATGLNDGTSWANAFTSLQSALQAAHTCPGIDEVWVAEGTYKPSAYPHGCTGCATNRDFTFHIRDGLKIYGGFAGTETSIGARNITAHPTILSGDFDDNDVVTGSGATLSITGNGENAHHVVLAVAPSSGGIGVTVDGFNITGGNADGLIYLFVNSITIFRTQGGGIYIVSGNNIARNNVIFGNYASFGAGCYLIDGTNAFNNNISYNNYSSQNGGGIQATGNSINSLYNNNIYGNHAGYRGGGMAFGSLSSFHNTIVTCNTIHGNNSLNGGGIYTFTGIHSLQNNIFWANQKNGSTTVAGADYENDTSFPATNTFTNNMLQLPNNTTNYPTTGGTTYSNNIYATDPLFVDPSDPDGPDNLPRTADDGLAVLSHSPAVDNGTTAGAPVEDITGFARSTIPDIGAYEVACSPTPRSVYLSGSNHVGVPGYSEINTFAGDKLTLEAWVSASTLQPLYWQGSIVSKSSQDPVSYISNGFDLRMGANGIDFNLGTNSGFQSALYTFTPQTHRWYHIAGVFDGDSLKLYLDGQRVAGLAYSGIFNNNTEPLFIGENGTWTGRHFHGRIDEVKVWNRALKPGELSYFSRHTHCNPYGLVAYFQFNEDENNNEPINTAPDSTSPEDGSFVGARSCAGVEMLASPSQIYVNASALKSGDGSSWSQALKTLDEGIVASHYCTGIDKMHIAEGSYIPTYKPFEMWVGNEGREISTPSNRDATFHVRSGLEVLGGYNATTGDRNPNLYSTIISGDINDTGDPNFDLYHVGLLVYKNTWDINDSTIVDGLSFKYGKAEVKSNQIVNGQPIHRDNGGGIYIHGGRNRISNAILKINKADTKGGGMYATGFEHLSIKANQFDQNVVDEGDGGGACIIATGAGKSVLAEGNLFTQNTTDQRGGGVYQDIGTNPSTWTSNMFYDNDAVGPASKGGGMYNNTSTTITMKNMVFSNNFAILGGGLYGDKSNETVINSTFSNNVSDSGDGHAYFWESNNGAVIRNSIFAESNAINSLNPAMSNSIYQPGSTNCTSCPGANGSVSPNFLDVNDPNGVDNIFMTDDDGLTLKSSSSGLDAGNNTYIGSTSTDIKNGFRILNTIDIGAYEGVQCGSLPSILYVDASRPVSGAGDAWISAFKTLDEALYIAHKCPLIEEIRVAQGTYIPQLKPYDMNTDKIGFTKSTSLEEDRTFHIRSGLVIKGGYAQGGSTTPDPENNQTILNGTILPGINVYHVVLMDYANNWGNVSDQGKLEGFSIKNGKSATTASTLSVNGTAIPRDKGAGIISVNGNGYSLSILDISSVTGDSGAKGIYHMSGTATIYNVKSDGLEAAAGDVEFLGSDNVIRP